MFASGRPAAIGTSESPPPEPISTISGAVRPKASSQSMRAPSATEVDISPRSTSITNRPPSRSQAFCWDSFMRVLRRTKLTTSRRRRGGSGSIPSG